MLAINSTQP